MEISIKDMNQLKNGRFACVEVSPEYFRDGNYTHWRDQYEETTDMEYDEFHAWLVAEMNDMYDRLILYSDGKIYGMRGGISYAISYDEFCEDDYETFIRLAEEFGVGNLKIIPRTPFVHGVVRQLPYLGFQTEA